MTPPTVSLTLLDIIHRQPVPEPWSEGEKIPWNDPEFSRRMLSEHLTQDHDLASRRFVIIDQHVAWIHQQLLSGSKSHILDLGCGPGLYTSRLARLGHTCTGIDFSPASIEYARQQTEQEGLLCAYQQQDIRLADFGAGYDLVMFIFGELNVFSPGDARLILNKAWQALNPGGKLLLEVHTLEAVQRQGEQPAGWYASPGGLFSDRPHLCLTESFWDAQRQVATERYYIINAPTDQQSFSPPVIRHASSMQAYTQTQYNDLLVECGFDCVQFRNCLGDIFTAGKMTQSEYNSPELITILADKNAR